VLRREPARRGRPSPPLQQRDARRARAPSTRRTQLGRLGE
jgi:hypothetical protein